MCPTSDEMSQRWVDVSRFGNGEEMHLPHLGVRQTVGTRTHRKFVLREFKSAGMCEDFYHLAFSSNPVHIPFERCQYSDLELGMALFDEHPKFLSWHMLMTSGIFVWNIVEHPPFAQRFPEIVSNVLSRPTNS